MRPAAEPSRARRAFLAGFATACGLGALAALAALSLDPLQPRHGEAMTIRAPLGEYGDQKIVYHVSTKGSWRDREAEAWRLVAVVNNHLNAIEPNEADLRILFQGDGVDALRRAKANPRLAAAFAALKTRGVKFRICANTLEAYHLGLETLWGASEGDLVQAAVAELIHLQKQGFGYIKF
ncbi:MAG: DsrE family protein [Hyphomicrobiales bacterium]|uniref:DsrE family protein n=1 Tax=Rhabdaerophilum calidifontis TaxID=2604328 RepID=UPI00140B0523|nr:DsrE family protein [Rhabdaerophilum calidifontis]MCA1952389.1 DsrE family protein [Hyphomicrobiales bacterium]MCA1998268.1 DsrE family protein [Hyphomicrobiales bacterium]